MKRGVWTLAILLVVMQACSLERAYTIRQKHRIQFLEQVDFKYIVERYVNKSQGSVGTVEGIYSVSSIVTRKGRNVLSGEEKEKVKDREENYSTVAIIRDTRKSDREYIEVSLNKDNQMTYPVVGEFSGLSESNLLVYKHFDPRGKVTTYTFSYDKAKDILEGVRTETNNNATITYKLTYLKIAPKSANYSLN